MLPPRGGHWFDGKGAFNPRITRYKNEYLLYYVGVTYDFPIPQDKENIWADGRAHKAWMHKRTDWSCLFH
ncbi:hypothetical protein [Niabella ginsengisoli]|uniref:Uncharacterized protein n=1 Tax=Niabella ginsengisoli TaxID=522298 RepID=A0ABS9SRE5_9BACT|nr:hypothetical protein [Niabella ginsengisoli]MCH5600946.1 hypothetical protein [Niabella ginsengisoli]